MTETIIQNFDSGPASEEAATALVEPNAGTVYQIKTPVSVVGTVGGVTKTPGATVGTTVYGYGAILASGASFNGDVLFTAKVATAELEIVTGGATNTAVAGNKVTLTVTAATTGTQLAALITGVPAALALWGATAQGTGAAVRAQTLASTIETWPAELDSRRSRRGLAYASRFPPRVSLARRPDRRKHR